MTHALNCQGLAGESGNAAPQSFPGENRTLPQQGACGFVLN